MNLFPKPSLFHITYRWCSWLCYEVSTSSNCGRQQDGADSLFGKQLVRAM